MSRFLTYAPEPAYLLPPPRSEMSWERIPCVFSCGGELSIGIGAGLEQAYSAEGGELYRPAMMLSEWLYGYAVGDDERTTAGTAGGGGLGITVSGGRGEAGQLGAECVSAAARARFAPAA